MRNTAAYHVHIATQDITAGLVKRLANKLINLKIRISKRKISVITLERLLKKNIGTNEVENFSRRYCRGGNSVVQMFKEREGEEGMCSWRC